MSSAYFDESEELARENILYAIEQLDLIFSQYCNEAEQATVILVGGGKGEIQDIEQKQYTESIHIALTAVMKANAENMWKAQGSAIQRYAHLVGLQFNEGDLYFYPWFNESSGELVIKGSPKMDELANALVGVNGASINDSVKINTNTGVN